MWLSRSSQTAFWIPQWSNRDERHGRWAGLTTWEKCLAVERCGSSRDTIPFSQSTLALNNLSRRSARRRINHRPSTSAFLIHACSVSLSAIFLSFCKASRMRARSRHGSGIAISRFCRTFYSAHCGCGSALEDSAPNQSAWHSAGDAQSTPRGPGAASQTFWKRRCFSGSNAEHAPLRGFGNR